MKNLRATGDCYPTGLLILIVGFIVVGSSAPALAAKSNPLRIDSDAVSICNKPKRVPMSIIADNSGLVYVMWLADQRTDCDAKHLYCDNAYLTILDSGSNKLTTEFQVPEDKLIFMRAFSQEITNGFGTNVVYLTWAGRDSSCTETYNQLHYAKVVLMKDNPGSLQVVDHDSVTTYYGSANDGDIAVGPGDDLHFGFSDGRCYKAVFYKEWNGSSWEEGPRICDPTWTDIPTIVNIDCDCCERDSTCCPQHSVGCIDTCPLIGANVSRIHRGSDGTVHIVWRDTDMCQYYNKYKPDAPSITPDIVFHRQINSNSTWSDTTRLSTWGAPAHSSCLMPDDQLAVVWDDRIPYRGDTSGIWYSLKDPSGEFGDTTLIFFMTDSDTHQPGADGASNINATSHSDSSLHVAFNKSPSDVEWLRIKPSTSTIDSLTVSETNMFTRATKPRIAVDACGNAHIVYRYHDTEANTKVYYRRVIGDTLTHCTIVAPNGGEQWVMATDRVVRWRLCPGIDIPIDSLKLFVGRWDSVESSATWECMASSLPVLARSYTWNVDVDSAGDYLMKTVAYWTDGGYPDSCVDRSNSTFKIGIAYCPYLYGWSDGSYEKIGSVFGGTVDQETKLMTDWVPLNLEPSTIDGYLRAFIAEEGNELSHIYDVSIYGLSEEPLCVVPGRGTVPKAVRPYAPAAARLGKSDVLDNVVAIDGRGISGESGTEVELVFNWESDAEKGIFIVGGGGKPPVDPASAPLRGAGVGVVIDADGADLINGRGESVSDILLVPRHDIDEFGLEVRRNDSARDHIKIRLRWEGDHFVDYVGLAPGANIEPLSEAGELVHLGLRSGRDGISDLSPTLPVTLAAGDSLFITFDDGTDCASGPRSYVLAVTGYYEGQAALVLPRQSPEMNLKVLNAMPVASGSVQGAFALPQAGEFTLSVFDVQGRAVKNIAGGRTEAGEYAFEWDCHNTAGRRVGPGVYFIRLQCKQRQITKKVIIER